MYLVVKAFFWQISVCMDEGVDGLNKGTIDRGFEVPLIDRLGAESTLRTVLET